MNTVHDFLCILICKTAHGAFHWSQIYNYNYEYPHKGLKMIKDVCKSGHRRVNGGLPPSSDQIRLLQPHASE